MHPFSTSRRSLPPLESLTSLFHTALSHHGNLEIVGFGPGWLVVRWQGRPYRVAIAPDVAAPHLSVSDDPAPSDQHPALDAVEPDYSHRLMLVPANVRVMRMEDCGSVPGGFAAHDPEVGRLTMDFRASGDEIDPTD